MPDDSIRVDITADVSGLKSGLGAAKASINDFSAAAQQAQRYFASGVGTKDIESALLNFGFSAKAAAAAVAGLGVATEAAGAKAAVASNSFGGAQRTIAMAGARMTTELVPGIGMAGYQLARVASLVPGLGLAFEAALPISLIVLAVEQISKFRDEVEKASRESLALATASYRVADGVQLENEKLQDQISKLQGFPAKNSLLEALLEDKAAAEALSKSLLDASQKANDLLTVGALSQFFTKASGNEKAAAEALQPYINAIAAANLKLAEVKTPLPGNATKAAIEDQKNAVKGALQEEIDAYDRLNAAIQGQITKMQTVARTREEGLAAAGAAGAAAGLFAPSAGNVADSIAKLQEYQAGVTQATEALKAQQAQGPLRLEVAGLENQKAQTDATNKEIEAEEKLLETIAKTNAERAAAALAPRLETAKALPELDLSGIEAKKKAVAEALDDERTQNLVAANDIFQIKLEENTKELGLYAKGSENYKRTLDKMKQDEADFNLQVVTINKEADQKIADSNRELENRYREMLDKQAVDAQNAAERAAALEIEENRKAQDQILADSKRANDLRRAQQAAELEGLKPGPIRDILQLQQATADYNANAQAIARLNSELKDQTVIASQLKAILAGGGILTPAQIELLRNADSEINRIKEAMKELGLEQIKLSTLMDDSWTKVGEAIKNATETGFTTFNENIVRMLSTTQSFSKTMINTWNSMVASFISAALKIAEQWVATEILRLATTTSTNTTITTQTLAQNAIQKLDNAKTAASKAMASTPFPLDLIVGPLVFAAALAFEKGGIIPGGLGQAVPIIGHAGEAVLPAGLTSFLQSAAASHVSNASSSTSNSSANISLTNNFHRTGDLSEANISRLVMRGAKRGKLALTR